MIHDRTAIDRFIKLTKHLCDGGVITTQFIEREFDVSRATAKRSMVVIECSLPVAVRFEQTRKGCPPRKVMVLLKGAASLGESHA